jgi:polyhydroxybutyrate depolymerase
MMPASVREAAFRMRESGRLCVLFRIISLCACILVAVSHEARAEGKGSSMVHEVEVHGAVRNYILHIPPVPDGKGLPLMIVLHGGLGNAGYMERTTGMNRIADAGGFMVAYPEGTGGRLKSMQNRRTWNAGLCCGQAVKQNADDVSFIAAMIDQIRAKYPIDTRRVYVAGHSNGAMLAYRLACEIPDKIAAVIAVSGTLSVDTCDRAKDVPLLHIHGEQDQNVPFEGGRGKDSLADVAHRSVPDSLRSIMRSRQCSVSEEKMLNSGIQATSYACKKGAPVLLYVIKGGGHAWPGGNGRRDSNMPTISASELSWEFAKQFRKP